MEWISKKRSKNWQNGLCLEASKFQSKTCRSVIFTGINSADRVCLTAVFTNSSAAMLPWKAYVFNRTLCCHIGSFILSILSLGRIYSTTTVLLQRMLVSTLAVVRSCRFAAKIFVVWRMIFCWFPSRATAQFASGAAKILSIPRCRCSRILRFPKLKSVRSPGKTVHFWLDIGIHRPWCCLPKRNMEFLGLQRIHDGIGQLSQNISNISRLISKYLKRSQGHLNTSQIVKNYLIFSQMISRNLDASSMISADRSPFRASPGLNGLPIHSSPSRSPPCSAFKRSGKTDVAKLTYANIR